MAKQKFDPLAVFSSVKASKSAFLKAYPKSGMTLYVKSKYKHHVPLAGALYANVKGKRVHFPIAQAWQSYEMPFPQGKWVVREPIRKLIGKA